MQPAIPNLTRLFAIALLGLLVLPGTAIAQTQDLMGGLKAGPGVTDLYGDDVSGTEVRVLFSSGAFTVAVGTSNQNRLP